VFFALTIFYLY